MDFRDTQEEAEFRIGLRSWLAANLPDGWADRPPQPGRGDFDQAKVWGGRLYEAGYVGLTWPKEYGGQGRKPTYQAICLEELARVNAPGHPGVIGLNMAGPTIIAWGTEEQKGRFLKPLLNGDEIWCQGFSEPGSGSDLASARTHAEQDGDHWVVNGQKVWSSYAHRADWCILVVRTDPAAAKHKGLSYLIVDMHAQGVKVRPLHQITGDPEFNEIFFDDVRVPRTSILGEPGDGWKVAMTTLLHERGTLGFGLSAELERMVNHLIKFVKQEGPDGRRPADDPLVRDAVAREWTEMQSLRFTNYRALTALLETGIPGPEGSGVKLAWSEANQRLTSLARSLLGMTGQLSATDENGFWQYWQLRSRGNTIEAGTSEILRNIIAERVLGLPKGR